MSVPAYLMEDPTSCTGCAEHEAGTEAEAMAKPAVTEPLWVANNGFYPVLDLRDFEATHQVDASFDEYRRLQKLKQAIRNTNDELEEQTCCWTKAGYLTLEVVPQDTHEIPVYERIDDVEPVVDVEGHVLNLDALYRPVLDVNGKPVLRVERVLIEAYKNAVYAKAMQLISDRYHGTDIKEYGLAKSRSHEGVALNYEQEYREAIYTLTGRQGRSIGVELI